MAEIKYFRYEGMPCQVRHENGGMRISAEGYFAGKGFLPVPVADILFHGEAITEKEFKSFVVELRRSAKS